MYSRRKLSFRLWMVLLVSFLTLIDVLLFFGGLWDLYNGIYLGTIGCTLLLIPTSILTYRLYILTRKEKGDL